MTTEQDESQKGGTQKKTVKDEGGKTMVFSKTSLTDETNTARKGEVQNLNKTQNDTESKGIHVSCTN
jgi:hypothetical protein